jgi:hypothetical protein
MNKLNLCLSQIQLHLPNLKTFNFYPNKIRSSMSKKKIEIT